MKYLIAAVLLIATGMGGYAYWQTQHRPAISAVRFTLIDGRRLSMQELQGRPVLVTFWATTCASCLREIPQLISLYNQYSAQGLEIIAVAMPYDRPDHVLNMTQQRKLPYPVALDIDANIVRAFGNVRVTPSHFLITPDGRISYQRTGILDMAETERWLQSMLRAPLKIQSRR